MRRGSVALSRPTITQNLASGPAVHRISSANGAVSLVEFTYQSVDKIFLKCMHAIRGDSVLDTRAAGALPYSHGLDAISSDMRIYTGLSTPCVWY